MSKALLTKVINRWYHIKRKRWLRFIRKRNQNHDFSLISNDCIGGVICHDLGEQFRSPLVNVGISNDSYLDFVQNLEYYLSCEIKEKKDDSKPYPVGILIPKDNEHIAVELNFVHDHSYEAACQSWKKRCTRVNYDSLYFIWHFYDDEENIEKLRAFDRWSAKTLAILHMQISGITDCAVTTCYDRDPHRGKILDIVPRTGKRYLDEIDYIGFLNR